MSISALEGALMKKSYSNYQLCFTTKVKGKISCKISSLPHPHPKYNIFDNTIKTEKKMPKCQFSDSFLILALKLISVLQLGLPETQGCVQSEDIKVFVFVFLYF